MDNITDGLRKVQRVRVFEQALDQLNELIEQGDLKPGDRLPTEQELAEALDVGRSTVREALRVLEANGHIEVRRGAGTFVAPRSAWTTNEVLRWLEQREESLVQLLQVRESIEGLTASLAARSMAAALHDKLKANIGEQIKCVSDDADASVHDLDCIAELDIRFHQAIAEASGNDIALEIVNRIVPGLLESNKAVLFAYRRADQTIKEHQAILAALKAEDPAAAESAMRAHIRRVRGYIERNAGEQLV